jgi:hypothetical protein
MEKVMPMRQFGTELQDWMATLLAQAEAMERTRENGK